MAYKITFYCPDQHIQYNLYTLDERGIGGGITARIRMAHALASLGHSVTMYNNCPAPCNINGVSYSHFDQAKHISADIFIASTSGGNFDLGRLNSINIQAKLRILMVHGISPPKNFHPQQFDFIYALSNYVRGVIEKDWHVSPEKIFVSYRGVRKEFYTVNNTSFPKRDPYSVVYTGHPSKGLTFGVKILRLLRQIEPRFSLHIFGGHQLWGENEQPIQEESGVIYHGLIGQRKLAGQLSKYNFSLNLQTREEPFGMVVIEAMRAGCIVIASPVGAFPELITNGENGFLIQGNPNLVSTLERTTSLMLNLLERPSYSNLIREKARVSPLNWEDIAKAWSGHWNWAFGNNSSSWSTNAHKFCESCQSECLILVDGLHCIECGWYKKFN